MEKELILARLHAARLQKENIELKGIVLSYQLRDTEAGIAELEHEIRSIDESQKDTEKQ